MKYIRIFHTADGGSSMEKLTATATPTDFIPGKPALGVTDPRVASTAKFLQVGPGWDGDWHPTPVRQYLVTLRGGWRVTTTDGQSAEIMPGDVALLEDTNGRGHNSVMLGDTESWILAVALE